jgi:ribosome biogenesis GTPase
MPAIQAQVIATFSRRMRVRLAGGVEVEARIKGKRMRPVCGDRVSVEPIPNEDDWLITAIEDRINALTRPNLRGDVEVLAANVDKLVVVAAPAPMPDWFVVDRYVAAAEQMGIQAAIVYNKTDLDLDAAEHKEILADYGNIGYPVLECSAAQRSGLDALEALLSNQTAIIVGQSGVGKSSLINAILGGEDQRTAEISAKSGEGRHTTVNSVLLDLPGGGRVIDSPGVRDYAPAFESMAAVAAGFREIEAASHHCRFANCRHLREPGCAVKAGVDDDTISARRYESYRRLLRLTEKLENQL